MIKERKDFGPAILPSKGLNERRATLHVFDHSEIIELPAYKGGKEHVLGHFYRCTETESIRLWGYERPTFNQLRQVTN